MAQLQARLSAYGVFRNAIATLRTALAPLKDLAKFQGRTTTLSSKDYLGAAATSASPTGSHAIEVVRLAQAHKLASGPYATSDTVVGEGTLTLTVGGTSTLITIDSSNQHL